MTEEQSKKKEHIEKHKEIYDRIDRVEEALFGDKFNKGMAEKINEMYDIFVGTNFTKRIIIGFIAFIGSIGALILMFIQIVKSLKE